MREEDTVDRRRRDQLKALSKAVGAPTRLELLQLIDQALCSEEVLALVAESSYRHQLGFEKFVLRCFPAGDCIRLHYWDRLPCEPEDIHSHCAGFHSRVVLGELTHEFFTFTEAHTHDVFAYRFDSRRGESEADLRGQGGVSEPRLQTLRRGECYVMPAHQLHRVARVAVGTLTVSHWKPRSADAVVLKQAQLETPPACARAGLPTAVVRSRLEDLRAKVSAA